MLNMLNIALEDIATGVTVKTSRSTYTLISWSTNITSPSLNDRKQFLWCQEGESAVEESLVSSNSCPYFNIYYLF